MRKPIVLAAALLVVTVVAALLLVRASRRAPAGSGGAGTRASAGAPDGARAATPAAGPSGGEVRPAPTRPPVSAARRIGPEEVRRLQATIEQARARRRGAARATAEASTAAPIEARDEPDMAAQRQIIQAAVREIVPLIQECYEGALARRPDLGGKIVVHFKIDGEPDVGGLVSDSAIRSVDPGLEDEELRECVQETMYALELPPPPAGGQITVTYPFVFRTEDAPEGERAGP